MKKSAKFLVLLITVFSLALFGCEGDDGDDGAQGPQGPPGPPGEDATVTAVETCTLCHDIGGIAGVELFHPLTQADAEDLPGIIPTPYDMTINSVLVVGGDVVVVFSMTDENGVGVAITPGTNRLRFTFNELIPAPTIGGLPDGPDQWVRYAYIRPSNGGILTALGGGAYTFNYNSGILGQIVDSADVFRVAGQLTGSDDVNEYNDTNWVFDYNFDGVSTFTSRGEEPSGRDIATTAACNSCHEALAIHGARYEYKYCVACHNPDELGDVDGDMVSMVHLIHSSSPDDPKEAAEEEWEVTYPADLRYCGTCHAGPNAGLGLTRPYADACGSCHSDVNFETGEGHLGGAATNNATCTICHPPDAIVAYHAIDENAFDFAYEVNSVDVDESGAPVVNFTITLDGTPIDACPPTGPFRPDQSPNFKVGYAVTAEGVENPIDYNNFGNGEDAAQPVSIAVCDVFKTATANEDGSYTATLPTTFPEGADFRTVGIDGYFYWTKGTETE
ncbi:MAG: hypothetical protein JRD88_11225, partial [Deltaproteobacteria bacterium]|nr:hypothetical protein [Deltaproteobacteria bacterium]